MFSPAPSPLTCRSSRSNVSLVFGLFAAAAFLATACPSSAQTTYSSSSLGCTQGGTGVSITGPKDSGSCTINVSGATGTVASVQVQINGIKSSDSSVGNSVYYTSFMLTGPNGKTYMLLGAAGDGDDNGGISGLNILFKDGASAAPGCPDFTSICGTMPSSTSVTYAPTSRWYNTTEAPVPSIFAPPNVQLPQPDGAQDGYTNQTFSSVFGGGTANNGWTLKLQNDFPISQNDPVSFTNWSLTLTFAALLPTTTGVSSSLNPSYTASPNNLATFTATVTSTGGTPTGTVAFTSNGSTISGCSAVAVSSGQATCTTGFSSHGIYNVTAAYSGDSSYGSSSGSVTQLVEAHATQNGNTFCNTGSVSVPGGNTTGSVYPSVIHVSGHPGQTVSNVEVQLLNVSGYPTAQHLLVSPDGAHNLDFFDSGFNPSDTTTGINLNFFDSAGQYPSSNNAPVSANYQAGDNSAAGNIDVFPSALAPTIDTTIPQVPGTINYGYNSQAPTARGPATNTFQYIFNGATADGDWSLYPFQYTVNPETIGGGWCIQLTVNTGVATTTTISSSANPGTLGSAVTLTATVKETASGNPVSGSTVTFTENGAAPAGTVSGNNVVTVDSNGHATFTSSALTEGDHQIVATYNGDTTDNVSTATLWQRINKATSVSAGSGTSINFCNANAVGSTGVEAGAATPNPSNIFVSGMPGTVSSMTLTLNNMTTPSPYLLQSLIAGPTGAALDFFSNTGSNSGTFGTGNYTFSDASPAVGQGSLTPGSYKPTAYSTGAFPNDSFTSSSSGFYNAPSTFTYAGTRGTGTFQSVFGSTNPNGTWSLFFDEKAVGSGGFNVANGWCLNFTTNAVTASVTAAHSGTSGAGSDFQQGEAGASITVSVANHGTGSTGDPTGGNPLTVVDTLDSAFIYQGYSGTGWSCARAGQIVTCTNDSSIAQGSSYPTLTLNVNVSNAAGASIGNTANVSGAGITSTSGSDTIPVTPAATLAVSVGHTGTVTQGSTAEWDVTVSNSATGSTTNGTINVTDTLPTDYTLAGASSVGNVWGCGASANVVTCNSSTAISGGSSSTIALTVIVPTTSPISVSNSASAYGGGDPAHSTSGTAVTSTADSITVTQVPASVTLNTGDSQSAVIGAAFATALTVTVKDAGGVAIASYTPVSFAAATGTNGQTGKFSNSSTIISTSADANGKVSETITAGTKVGAYSVTVTAGTAQNAFTLTNTPGLPAGIAVSNGDGQSTADTKAFSNSLVALVVDAGGNPVPGAIVTFTAPGSGASGIFSNSTTTISTTTDANGLASETFTANQALGNYLVSATVGAFSTNFSETNIVGAYSQLIVSVPPPVYATVPAQFTVTAEDAGGNLVPTATPTVQFTSTDSNAVLPAETTLTSGTATLAATFSAAGTWTISAVDSADSFTGTSSDISVATIPILVVNTATDDAGTASNCSEQGTAGTNPIDGSCSLRDALLEAASLGAASISFDSTKFASARSINAASTLNIPANTSIQGPTSGTGASLTNLLTVNGGGSSSNYPVLTVGVGVTANIANLILSQGNSTTDGGGIQNAGTLTVTGSTISGNSAMIGGGISNQAPGVLTLTNSTVSANSASDNGGGIYNQGTVTASFATISGNTASSLGGGVGSSNSLTLKDSTVSGNSAAIGGGIARISGGFVLTNDIVAGNTAPNTVDADGAFTTGGNNLIGDGTGLSGITNGTNNDMVGVSGTPIGAELTPLGNYGGPTQTLLLQPGSPAICAGLMSGILPGTTKDQRGFLLQPPGGYCASGSVDAGAVQSNYAISFTQAPPATFNAGSPISPGPIVSVTESGSAASLVSSLIVMTDTMSALAGTTTVNAAAGSAMFSNLEVTSAQSSDTFTATLTLNGTLNLTTSASGFAVVAPPAPTLLAFGTPPADPISAGDNAGSAITVEEIVSGTQVATLSSDTITLTVTYPDTTTQTYTQTAINGVATFDLSAVPLTQAGIYTYEASATGLSSASASETSAAGSITQLALTNYFTGSSTWPTEFTGWPVWVSVTPEDQYHNPVTGFTDTLHVTSDSSAVLPDDFTLCSCGGPFPITFNNAGTPTVTVTDTSNPSITGTSGQITVHVPDNIVVTTTSDGDNPGIAANCPVQADPLNPIGSACTLRDALAYSAANGAATITFSPLVFTGGTNSITLANGALEIPNDSSITGPSSGSPITVSGGNLGGVFQMTDPTAQGSITRLNITGGMISDSSESAFVGGAAIYNDGTLTVNSSVITGNSATASDPSGFVAGGAIYSDNDLEISNTVVTGNTANAGGVAIGGGIYNSSYINANGVTVSDNTAITTAAGGSAGGGGLFTVDADIDDSTFSGNSAQGPTDGSGSALAGGIFGVGDLWTAYTTIAGNSVTAGGYGGAGGYYVGSYQELYNSTISGNTSDGTAGGLLLDSGALMVLGNSIITANTAPSHPDVLYHELPIDIGGNILRKGSIKLAPLANYGGATQTILPLPGSLAICSGAERNIPIGEGLDERGFSNLNTTYDGFSSLSPCVDSGAVQTNYGLTFTTEPGPILPASFIQVGNSFQASVTVTENRSPASPSILVPLSLTGPGTLSGRSASTSAGVASYSSLKISAPGTGDKLTAKLTLNVGLAMSADSSEFDVHASPVGWAGPVTDAMTGGTSTIAQTHNFFVVGVAADSHDGSPVSQVQILIDGTPAGNARLGLPSPSFEAANNNPAFANAGWTFTASASGLSLGTHTLTVVATDSLSISKAIATESFTVANTSSGPPFGWVGPVADATTGGTITIAQAHNFLVEGATVDPHDGSPVLQVQILVDGVPAGNATLGLPSLSLAAKYNNPAFANGHWTFTGPASGLSLGTHTLTVIATDSLSLSATIATESFTVAATSSGPPFGWAGPVTDATTGGTTSIAQAHNLSVVGAAVDPRDGSPVFQVQILIDGAPVGTATLGLPSPDMAAKYNNPAFANGHWTFTASASGLSMGAHMLTVVATDSLSLSATIATESFTVTP